MKKNHLFPVLLVLIGFVALSLTTAKSVKLRLHPKQNYTYKIVASVDMATSMVYMGQTMEVSQIETNYKISFTPKTVTDKKNVIESKIDALKINATTLGVDMQYDSEHPEDASPWLKDQISDLNKSINKPNTVTYDELGKLIDGSLDNETDILNNAIIEFPEKELSVGSKWNAEKVYSIGDTDYIVNIEYTVKAISKNTVDLTFTGQADINDLGSCLYNGTAVINLKTGLMTKSTWKMTLSMTIEEDGQSTPMTSITNYNIEVK